MISLLVTCKSNLLNKIKKKDIGLGKTYYIRKVEGGGVSSRPLKKKNECWSLFHIPPPPWARNRLRESRPLSIVEFRWLTLFRGRIFAVW